MHVRCSKCSGRARLGKRPSEYVRRPPNCRKCGARMTLDGKVPPGRDWSPSRTGKWVPDRYRMRHEVGPRGPRPCRCMGYSFPHARGRGYCDHNPRLTADDMQQRHEEGSYA